MASRFWVLGTGTWDSSTTTNWSATSGGAGGASVPGSGDTVTFDGSSGGGTTTVNFGGLVTITSLDISAYTGTLDFATNNNPITITLSGNAVLANGASTKTLNMGTNTWTLSGTNAFFTTSATTTINASTSTLAFTGNGQKTLIASGKTFSTVSFSASSATGSCGLNQSSTIATLNIAAPNTMLNANGVTATITTLNVTGTSASAPVGFICNAIGNGTTAMAVTNNLALTYCAFASQVFSVGTHAATNSFQFATTSGITVTGPSAGGAGAGAFFGA